MLAMQKLKQPIWLRDALCCYSIKVQVSGICNFTLQCNPLGTVIFLIYGLLVFVMIALCTKSLYFLRFLLQIQVFVTYMKN